MRASGAQAGAGRRGRAWRRRQWHSGHVAPLLLLLGGEKGEAGEIRRVGR
jgi:hypothetical protein